MPFKIVRQDISKMAVDGIVNAANTQLQMGGGVCGAIFKGAGDFKMQAACDKLAPIDIGKAVITSGFDLPAKYVIHVAGTIYDYQDPAKSKELLISSYLSVLRLAVFHDLQTLAIPLISTGVYEYPKDQALQVANTTIREFLASYDIDVTLVVFDKASFGLSEKIIGGVDSYIDEHYAQEHHGRRSSLLGVEKAALKGIQETEDNMYDTTRNLSYDNLYYELKMEDAIGHLDESFSTTLLRLIDQSGEKDSVIYKRANVDRRLFSKIRSAENYRPSKNTVLAFAIALHLSLKQTDDLLRRAGYTLSHALKFDVIVEYYIITKNYNIDELNEVLLYYDQSLVGGWVK